MASIAPPIVGRRRKSLLKISFFIVAFIFLSKFSCGISHLTDSVNPFFWFSEQPVGKGKNRDSNLFMTEGQCRSAFPGLMNEIDLAVGRESERAKREGNNDGRSGLEKQPDDYTGLIEGRIKDGKLYVMSSEWRPSRMMLHERQAALHQLYRAIITSPTPLPDTIFSLSILDNPRKGSWSYSRTNDPKIQGNYWLMPHFSHWSWPKPFIGTMDTALTRISEVEKNNPWEKKIDKAVWRGTAWFNGVGNTALRPNLLREAKGKEWADVEDMQWQTNAVTASNSIEISDFCKYKYIIYTEGITYSGRLPFHQACASIILTPPPNYQMHTTHLMNPLFSYTLPFSPSFNAQKTPNGNPRWAKAYPPSEANVVFVEPDWSDLEQTINYLRKHDNVARGIAERQRETYIGGGYATEAAEVCYWRSLVRGWASVVKPKMGEWNETGIRWETFSLIGETRWDRAQ
ncbi:glycosyl transferase family 90-domain-containing protein [Halenospora varia]|nr:glycosyl transferase family 90-domain-containing protein [Halenospora varia]